MESCAKKSERHMSRGFTLVELLVVISIIGLIGSAVLYNLDSARIRGRDAQRIQDVDTIIKALLLHEVIYNRKFGTGSGCGHEGAGFGWFTYNNTGVYQKSIAQCFVDLGLTEGLIKDPLQTSTSNSTAGFTYMIGYPDATGSYAVPGAVGSDCIKGKTRYVYAKLEGRPQSGSALDTTCEIHWDAVTGNGGNGPGMNYFKKF